MITRWISTIMSKKLRRILYSLTPVLHYTYSFRFKSPLQQLIRSESLSVQIKTLSMGQFMALNEALKEEDTRGWWRRRKYDHLMSVHYLWDRWLRNDVNRWVYFGYRRAFYRLIFPIMLSVRVSPDLYEGQGWLQNPWIIGVAYSSVSDF